MVRCYAEMKLKCSGGTGAMVEGYAGRIDKNYERA
jgi:hypothetical protein